MNKKYKNKDWLIEQYYMTNLTLVEISKLVNKTRGCIKYWMKKNGIKIKPKFYHLKELNQNKEHQALAGKARARWTNEHYSHFASERMKHHNPGRLSHILFKERNPEGYYNRQKKAAKISGEIMRQRMTDWDFFNEHGMMKSQYPYPDDFNRTLKKKIFNRDGGLCRICFKFIVNGHAVHHIDYNKENNNEDNLILLCKSCHGLTTWNRDYWESYFKSMID